MTAIALAIVWYFITIDDELKNADKKVKDVGYSIAIFAMILIFALAIKDLFK